MTAFFTLLVSSSVVRWIVGVVAGVSVIAALFGYAYWRGYEARAAAEAAVTAAWQAKQTAASNAALKALRDQSANEKDALRAQADTANAALAKAKNTPCMDKDGADNLRSLWSHKSHKAAKAPAKPVAQATPDDEPATEYAPAYGYGAR